MHYLHLSKKNHCDALFVSTSDENMFGYMYACVRSDNALPYFMFCVMYFVHLTQPRNTPRGTIYSTRSSVRVTRDLTFHMCSMCTLFATCVVVVVVRTYACTNVFLSVRYFSLS